MAKAIKPFTLEIKPSCKDMQIGYNGSIAPLKDRTDYDVLMDEAMRSGSPTLLGVFVSLPTEQEWLDYKGAKYMEQNPE